MEWVTISGINTIDFQLLYIIVITDIMFLFSGSKRAHELIHGILRTSFPPLTSQRSAVQVCNSAINACAKGGQWQAALAIMDAMRPWRTGGEGNLRYILTPRKQWQVFGSWNVKIWQMVGWDRHMFHWGIISLYRWDFPQPTVYCKGYGLKVWTCAPEPDGCCGCRNRCLFGLKTTGCLVDARLVPNAISFTSSISATEQVGYGLSQSAEERRIYLRTVWNQGLFPLRDRMVIHIILRQHMFPTYCHTNTQWLTNFQCKFSRNKKLHVFFFPKQVYLYGVLTPFKGLHPWAAWFCLCLRACVPLWVLWAAWIYTCLPLVSPSCLPLWELWEANFYICLPLVTLVSHSGSSGPPDFTLVSHLSSTLVSHSGCFGPHDFTRVFHLSLDLCFPLWVLWPVWFHTCLPLVSRTCLPHWALWAACF